MNTRFAMKFSRRSTILGGAALAAGSAAPARAQLTIDMTKPSFEPVPIAIVDFAGDRVGADIAGVIRNDLQNSGLFRSIPPSAFIQQNVDANAAPRFADWRGVGAAGLVVGQVQQAGGNIKVDFRLWDVVVGQQATGLSFNSQPTNWRRLAHIIADAIYKRVTGEEGYFDTRVAYVSETGPLSARVKRIAIMDQDGANNRYITDGRTIALTPRFSPTLQEIVYMAYPEDRSPPRVYLQNVDSGRRELLGNFPGMSFAPRFSPDGTKVVMSISAEGQSDIYEMDVRGRALRRRWRRAAHQLRRRPLRHAGVVAARRLHRLHQDHGRQLRHRRDAHRRQRRAHAGQRLPGRGTDLGAQRPRADVLPPAAQFGQPRRIGHAQSDRHHGTLRTSGADANRRVGPGLVTLDSAVAKDMIVFLSGRAKKMRMIKAFAAVVAMIFMAACSNTEQAAAPATTTVTPGSVADFRQNVGDRVFFDTDISNIREDGRQTLNRQAEWLKKYTNYPITIEGHCDERGTREYNLALGERRANAARQYLIAQGIPAARIKTISYGKERPDPVGSDEAAWALNRRAVTELQ